MVFFDVFCDSIVVCRRLYLHWLAVCKSFNKMTGPFYLSRSAICWLLYILPTANRRLLFWISLLSKIKWGWLLWPQNLAFESATMTTELSEVNKVLMFRKVFLIMISRAYIFCNKLTLVFLLIFFLNIHHTTYNRSIYQKNRL